MSPMRPAAPYRSSLHTARGKRTKKLALFGVSAARYPVKAKYMKILISSLTAVLCLATLTAPAQDSTTLAGGLRAPTKIIFSQEGNLLVAEQGTAIPNTGRVSIVDPTTGAVRTLL